MTNLLRIKLRWSGFQGGPGFSVFHFREFASGGGPYDPSNTDAAAAGAKIKTFAEAVKALLPNVVTLTVEPEAEVIEDTDAALVKTLNVGTIAGTTGTAGIGITHSAAAGAVIDWRTSTIRKRRRVQGRTFLVPLASSAFASDGTLASGTITTLTTAATALADQTGSPDLFVYGRPTRVRDAQGKYTGQTLPDGMGAAVTGVKIPDMTAILKSRRD